MNFSFWYRKPCVKAASYNMSPFLHLRYTSKSCKVSIWLLYTQGLFLFNTNPQLLQLWLAFSTVQIPDLHSPWSIIMIKVKALKIRTVWDNLAWSNDAPFKREFHNKNSLNPWQNKVMSLAPHGTNCGESIGLGGVRTYPFLCLHQPVFYQ